VTHASTLTNSKRNFLEADSSNQTNSKDSLGVDSPDHTNSGGVPHVRTSVRGFRNTGRSPIKGLSFLPDKADDKGRTGGAQRGRVGEQERLAEPQALGSRICGSGVLESLRQ
jgi:hypothetical protein